MNIVLKCPPEGRLGGRAYSFSSDVDMGKIGPQLIGKVVAEPASKGSITLVTTQQLFFEVLELLRTPRGT